MSRSVRKKANSLAKATRTRLRFRNVALALCVLVAVGVSYVLINPATTQVAETFCGYEEHLHTDECYEKILICGLPESGEGHEHSDACYEERQSLICTLPETDGHIHTDACRGEQTVLACTLPETDGHTHTEECFTWVQTLICTEDHEHTEECYLTEQVCICGLEECAPHHHDEGCYVTEQVLVCGLEECAPHHHDENCYVTERVLVCGLEECEGHIHGDACYAINHDNLICGKDEHEHTLQCFSNPAADLENASVWEQSFERVELSTNWSKDVIAIAQTQLGYAESTANYQVMDDGVTTKGYSRYGAWYGDPYGDWCAMFCSFCLNYAGVDEQLFPFDSNCDHWIYMLGKEEFNLFRTPAEYIPNPGDLVFFDWGSNGSVDHVGFVAEVKADEEGNPAEIRTLEGNNGNQVNYFTYRISDPQIVGYGQLPVNPNETWIEPEPDYELIPIAEEEQVSEEISEEGQEPAEQITQTFTGEDYTVVATYDSNSGIPENAVLQARKLQPGTEEYEAYYQQAIDAMIRNGQAADEASLSISYMEFYDIGFYVDGIEVEPTGAVSIVVTPNEAVELQEGDVSSAIHFGQNGTEVLDTETEENSFSFVQGSFSVTAVVVSSTTYTATDSVSNGDEVIVATWHDGTTYYLTNTNDQSSGWSLKLVTDKDSATVWTISNSRLKFGTQYVNIWDGGSGMSSDNAAILHYRSGYWEIECSWGGLYLNQYGGASSVKAAGYSASGAYDDGSRWVLLKKGSSTPAPAFTVTKEASGTPEAAGDKITYTIKVKNTGNVALKNISVAGSMDGDTCSTSTLAVGATYTKSFEYTVTQADATAKKVTNTITSATAKDSNNNTVSPTGSLPSVETAVAPQPITGAPAVGTISGVQTDKLTVGEWYIIYSANGYALDARGHTDGDNIATMTSQQLSQYGSSGTVEYAGSADVVWQWDGTGFRNRNGDYLRIGCRGQDELYPANLWLDDNTEDSQYNLTYNSTYRILYNTQSAWGVKYNKLYMSSGSSDVHAVSETSLGAVQRSGGQAIYLAQVTGTSSTTDGHDNHPKAAITGVPDNTDLVFFNVDATDGSTVKGLAGVTYTIWDSDGNEVGSYMSTSEYGIRIGRLTPGETYTIRQTGVPSGYIVVSQDKTFTVSSDGTAVIGTFYDYKTPGNYDVGKTASVVDYLNRTYQIDLHTSQNLYEYSVESFDFNWVIDQSNSMLFPSSLQDTGKDILLYESGRGNGNRLNQLGLDKNQVYYIITDQSQSSTVWAVFWDGSGWAYQDASYYAKAQNRYSGEYRNIMDGNMTVDYAKSNEAFTRSKNNDTQIVSGGGIDFALGGQVGSETTNGKYFDLYTGSTYNRLHDLQQSLNLLASTLAALNPNITVRLETFDKQVETCKSYSLGSEGSGVKNLIQAVNDISTSGGTRQDLALDHLRGQNSAVSQDHNSGLNHLNNGKKQYILLVTDGAPAGVSDGISLVTTAANNVKAYSNVTLITLGLSMKNVTGGSQMLKNAATNSSWSYAAENSQETADAMTDLLFRIASPENYYDFKADIRDEISDSFYPINPSNNQALTDGTIINLDGTVRSYKPSSGKYGTVKYDSTNGTWYVVWSGQNLAKGNRQYPNGVPWDGRIYVKAKEDFIGGNTIDTNKQAIITVKNPTTDAIKVKTELPTPTVNVRLLQFNEVNSEETIFLGDGISVQEKIEALKEQLEYTKLVNNGDAVHNRSDSSTTPGLETATFTLPYAWGRDLTDDEWDDLIAGRTVTIEYTYDDPSSHGPVGYFTLTLTKTGDTSNYTDHASTATGEDVEAYTLKVVYTPYEIGDHNNERKENVHNGNAGPGTEVTASETHNNTHTVTVVDGKITIDKEITKLLKAETDQNFAFRLSKLVDDEFVDTGKTITVTVPADSTTGEYVLTALPRGTYRIEEVVAENAEYYVKESAVVDDGTNCEQNTSTANAWVFTIGSDGEGNDLIVYTTGTGYRPVYSSLREGYTGTEGISFETVRVLNDKVAYTAEIPVEKIWQQVDSKYYENKKVYVVLYQNGSPVYDDPNAEVPKVMALELSDDNDWQGKFTVALPDKDAKVEEQGYSIRELSNADTRQSAERTNPAIVMNAGENDPTLLYYEDAIENGVVYIASGVYNATASMNTVNGVYSGTVINRGVYELPKSGGSGIIPYILCGLLLTAGAAYGYVLRRRRERRQAKHLL